MAIMFTLPAVSRLPPPFPPCLLLFNYHFEIGDFPNFPKSPPGDGTPFLHRQVRQGI